MVAVWLALAWIFGLILAVILIVAVLAYPTKQKGGRFIESFLLVYTLVASLIGFGGVGNAVGELLAG